MEDVPGVDREPREAQLVTELREQIARARGCPQGLVVPAKVDERLKQRVQCPRNLCLVPCRLEDRERLLMAFDSLLVGSQCPERVAPGPQGESAEVLVSKPASDGVCRLGQSERPLPVDVKLLAGGGNQAIDDRPL